MAIEYGQPGWNESMIPGYGLGGVMSGIGAIGGALDKYQQIGRTQAGYGKIQEGINQGIGALQEGNKTAQGILSPYHTAGQGVGDSITGGLQSYQTGGNAGVSQMQNLANTQVDPSQFYSPGMAFAMQQGRQAMERSAAARGGVMSSGAMKDISGYITGIASQNYNDAAGLALKNRDQQIGAAGQLMQGGLGAANTLQGMYGTQAGAAGHAADLEAGVAGSMAGAYGARGNAAGMQAATDGGLGSTLGAIGTIGGAIFGGPGGAAAGGGIGQALGSLFSDRRLKKNITRISTNKLGLGVYEYDYIWGDHAIGVMADEVKAIMPEAVTTHRNGYDMVNYDLLDTVGAK